MGRRSKQFKSKNLSLKTIGKPRKIYPHSRQSGLFTVQQDMGQTINASGRCMLKIRKKIRSTFSRMSMETCLSMSLLKLPNSFTLKRTKLRSKLHELYDCFAVFCTDISQLNTRACSWRFIDQSCARINIRLDFVQCCWPACSR